MPIDWSRKVLFIHIPKTGGTTVNDLMGIPRRGRRNLFGNIQEGSFNTKGSSCYHHQPIDRLLDWGLLPRNLKTRFYIFTVVRNPYDRIASEYKSRSQKVPNLPQHKSLKHFLQHCSECLNSTGGEWMNDALDYYYNHLLPQHCFIYREGEELVCDRVCTYENFQNDVSSVFRDIGEEPPKVFPKKNASNGPDYRELFDNEAFQMVEDLYSIDFDLLCYDRLSGS